MREELTAAIADIREDDALELARRMLDGGGNPREILEACREGMSEVGKRYEDKDYFLPELIVAGDMLKSIAELVKPLLQGDGAAASTLGTIVIGTVEGDIHDVGKDIVAFMLDSNNFEVIDLGVDVPASKFIEEIETRNPEIVAMSGFLTLAFDQMRETVAAIDEAGLRDRVKIMIGGAPMDDTVTKYIGADAYGPDASAAVTLAKSWVEGS
ncbi:MAG: cobalamin-dependent protein [Thermoleophilia bacterium]|nr:cobalamin-dependent protein [Thermoleophilia bacterium]